MVWAKTEKAMRIQAMNNAPLKTTLEEFRQSLLSSGSYRTQADHRASERAKPSALSTLRFTAGVAKVFPLCALYEPFGKLDTDKWAHFCFSTVQTAERMGMNVIVEDWEKRAAYSGPVMYLCNHMSTLETILLPPVLLTYGPFNVVVKASLSHLPFLEKAAAHMGLVPIGRKSPREDLMTLLRVGAERIYQGNSFLIFPQGSREKVFSRKLYSSIGAKLAEKAGVPICPIAVDTRCQPTRDKGILSKVFKDFGTVNPAFDIRCRCGDLIPCTKSKEMHSASFDWIASTLEEWGMDVER